MKKRRKHKRVSMNSEVHLWDEIEERLIGQLCNVSFGGLLVLTDRELPLEALYQTRIQPATEGLFPAFSIGVETLWSQPASQGKTTWVGMKIIALSEEGEGRLKEMMADQGG